MKVPVHVPVPVRTPPRWHFVFIGRRKGTCDVLGHLTACREGLTPHLAQIQLYNEFEQITVLSVKEAPW